MELWDRSIIRDVRLLGGNCLRDPKPYTDATGESDSSIISESELNAERRSREPEIIGSEVR